MNCLLLSSVGWLADVAQDKKQEKLDNYLFSAIKRELSGGETMIIGLLDAGADANTAVEGYKGVALVYAVEYDQPLSVIEKLYKKVAKFDGDSQFFDDAIKSMKIRGYEGEMVPGVNGTSVKGTSVKGTTVINRVKALREHFTGKPATVEIQPEVLQKLMEELATTKKELLAQRADAPEKPRPAATRFIRPQA